MIPINAENLARAGFVQVSIDDWDCEDRFGVEEVWELRRPTSRTTVELCSLWINPKLSYSANIWTGLLNSSTGHIEDLDQLLTIVEKLEEINV